MNRLWVGVGVTGIVAILAGFRLASARAEKAKAIMKIKQGALVIDVRTANEYAGGHYEGAKNIPVQELQGRLAEAGDPKSAIVVYCASGIRSAAAARLLSAAGFTDVTNAGTLANLTR